MDWRCTEEGGGTRWGLVLLIAVAVGWSTGPAAAQDVTAPSGATVQALAEAGYAAFTAGRYVEARDALRAVLRADAAYRLPEYGPAAYWLGRTYEQLGDPEAATTVWYVASAALAGQGLFDQRLADAFVWTVFREGETERYATATALYYSLLRILASRPAEAPGMPELRRRYLAPLALVLPEPLRTATGLADPAAVPAAPLTPEDAARWVDWWRRADPLPATERNERLTEHLERLTHAAAAYASDEAPAGLDPRGEIYLRFGPPFRRVPITFNAWDYVDLVTPGEFPDNEFWVYQQIHDQAAYLFLDDPTRGWREVLPYELIPSPLRHRRSQSERLLLTMEAIYRQLALYANAAHFGTQYDAIADYRSRYSDLQFASNLLTRQEQRASLGAVQEPPSSFARRSLAATRSQDRRATRQRDAAVPAARTSVFDTAERLPVDLRWARFLNDDGTTRTEIYWAVRAADLEPTRRFARQMRREGHATSDDYVLTATAVWRDDQFQRLGTASRRTRVAVPEEAGDAAVLPAQTLVVPGDTAAYGLGLQWEAFWVIPGATDTSAARLGPRIKMDVVRVDTVQALQADERRLEMSDLKPLRLLEAGATIEEAVPYPNRRLSPNVRLALAFEVYHLAFDADDRTRYRVAYTVRRQADGGLLRRRGPVETTESVARYTGTARAAREQIVVDLGTWTTAGALTVTVRVTDEVTGQAVERTIDFEAVR